MSINWDDYDHPPWFLKKKASVVPVCHLEKRKEVERWRRDIYQATDLDIGATLQPVSATLPRLPPYIATLPSCHLTVMPSCHILITCNLFLTGRRTISYSAHGLSTFLSIMSEKLCLQWNDFQENVKSSFAKLRGTTDFINVTLTCEDGH